MLVPPKTLFQFFEYLHTFLVYVYSFIPSTKSKELRSVEFTVALCNALPPTVNYVKFGLEMFSYLWPDGDHYLEQKEVVAGGRTSILLHKPKHREEKPVSEQKVVLYAYGGSFLGGTAVSQVNFAHSWAGDSIGADGILLVEYGQWPLHIEQMVEVYGACYEWLLEQGYKPKHCRRRLVIWRMSLLYILHPSHQREVNHPPAQRLVWLCTHL